MLFYFFLYKIFDNQFVLQKNTRINNVVHVTVAIKRNYILNKHVQYKLVKKHNFSDLLSHPVIDINFFSAISITETNYTLLIQL